MLTDEEIGKKLASCAVDDNSDALLYGNYHVGPYVGRKPRLYHIEGDTLWLGEGDSFYSVPLSLTKLRELFQNG